MKKLFIALFAFIALGVNAQIPQQGDTLRIITSDNVRHDYLFDFVKSLELYDNSKVTVNFYDNTSDRYSWKDVKSLRFYKCNPLVFCIWYPVLPVMRCWVAAAFKTIISTDSTCWILPLTRETKSGITITRRLPMSTMRLPNFSSCLLKSRAVILTMLLAKRCS